MITQEFQLLRCRLMSNLGHGELVLQVLSLLCMHVLSRPIPNAFLRKRLFGGTQTAFRNGELVLQVLPLLCMHILSSPIPNAFLCKRLFGVTQTSFRIGYRSARSLQFHYELRCALFGTDLGRLESL